MTALEYHEIKCELESKNYDFKKLQVSKTSNTRRALIKIKRVLNRFDLKRLPDYDMYVGYEIITDKQESQMRKTRKIARENTGYDTLIFKFLNKPNIYRIINITDNGIVVFKIHDINDIQRNTERVCYDSYCKNCFDLINLERNSLYPEGCKDYDVEIVAMLNISKLDFLSNDYFDLFEKLFKILDETYIKKF